MVNRIGFESIQLKQSVLDGHIADEMEGFHRPHRTDAILLLRKVPWLRSPWKQESNTHDTQSSIVILH